MRVNAHLIVKVDAILCRLFLFCKLFRPPKNIVMGLMKQGLTGDVEYQNLFPNTKYRIHTNLSGTAQHAPRRARVLNLQHQSR